MLPLTERQQQVLDFVSSYIDHNGCPPTLREISVEIGTAGTVSAIRHLEALERKGHITRRDGSRGIALVGRGGSVSIPVVGKIKAGVPSLAVEDITGYYSVDMSWIHGEGCFFLVVDGDSMIDAHILDGDLVLIRPQQTADNGQIVAVLVDGEATLKRFYREQDHIRLQPENSAMEPIIVNPAKAETMIIGKLLKVVRNFQ